MVIEPVLRERLRALVRARVKNRSERAKLARYVQQPMSWVTFYLDEDQPTRHADFDTSVELMRFVGVTFEELLQDDPPIVTAEDLEIRALWRALDDEQLRNVVRAQIAGLLPLVPRVADTRLVPQSPPAPLKRARKSFGRRRGA